MTGTHTALRVAAALVALLAGQAAPETAATGTLTLDDCFAAALKRSEAVGEQREAEVQAREHVFQAAGSLLPSVSGMASWMLEDQAGSAGTSSSGIQPLAKITATQPLFRGGRAFFAVRQAAKLAEAQSAERRHAETALYRDLVQCFYSVLSVEQDVRGITDQLRSYDDRIRELQGREQLGRSRMSEILAAQSARAGLQAQAEQLNGQVLTTRETLVFLTGLDRTISLADSELSATALEPLESYLSGAEHRPDVVAASLRSEAARIEAWAARSALLPSVDLVGNYYLKRTGPSEDVIWDAQLALTLPLFAGGANLSRMREATSIERQGALELSRVRRATEQDIRTLYARSMADSAQARALSSAADLADRNYREQAADYKLGLVTNIDVLQALAGALESRRALDRALFALKADILMLEAAAGRESRPRGNRTGP